MPPRGSKNKTIHYRICAEPTMCGKSLPLVSLTNYLFTDILLKETTETTVTGQSLTRCGIYVRVNW